MSIAALDHGITRFEQLLSICTIRAARQAILLSASEDIIQFDQFQHLIQARQGKARLDLRSLPPALKGRITDMTIGLGLHSGSRPDTGTIAALAIMAGIMDNPLLRDTHWPRVPISPRLRSVLDMIKLDPTGKEHKPMAYVFGDKIGE